MNMPIKAKNTPAQSNREPEVLQKLFTLTLVACVLVILLRIPTKTDLGYDITLQIEAAQHFVEGKGLTIYNWNSPIGTRLELQTLTHFPCGFSFFIVAAMSLGLPLALAIKIYGALLTFLGWFGWGRFTSSCLGKCTKESFQWTLLACFFACTMPLFYTPGWNGTDIFLWALVPWILRWLALAGLAEGSRQIAFYSLVGFACGLCILMRYAGVLLAGYAVIVIVLQTGVRPKLLCKRWLAFGLAIAPLLGVQLFLILFGTEGRTTPGGINAAQKMGTMLGALYNGAVLLPMFNCTLFSWAPDRVFKSVIQPGTQAIWPYIFTMTLFCLPRLIWQRLDAKGRASAFTDERVLAAGLVAALPLFLWVCMVVGFYTYVGDRRYYLPIIPMVLILAFYIAAPCPVLLGLTGRIVKRVFIVIIGIAMILTLIESIFIFIPTAHGAVERKRLMQDADLKTLLSLGLSYNDSPMRQYTINRMRADADLYLLTNFESLFYAEPEVDRSRVHRIPYCDSLVGTQITGPLRFLIVAIDRGDDMRSLYTVHWDGSLIPASCLQKLPNLKLIRTVQDPIAGPVKILESTIPSGVVISFN